MDKNAAVRNFCTENWSLFFILRFQRFVFFHCHQGKKYNCYQDSFVVFCIFGFWLRKASQQGFHRWLFLLVVHLGFYRRETEKTKAFLTSLTSFQELHLRGVWVIALFCLVQFNGGVCSYSIPLPNAKPDRIQTNRKQGFKLKRLRTITLLSPFNEKCFCLKTFFKFWLSVKNSAFCYLASVSSGLFFGVWVEMPREWS